MQMNVPRNLAMILSFSTLFATTTVPNIVAAQASSEQTAPKSGLPVVPTTKILAIGRLTPKATLMARRDVMPNEVRDTMALYLKGKIDQWYFKQDLSGVVFIMNVTDPKEARELLERLPLGQAGMMEFDVIPLGPLSPLALLLGPASGTGQK